MSEHITEFRAGESRHYNLKSPGRWVLSHVMHYPWLPVLALCCSILNNLGFSWRQLAVGRVFDVIGVPGWTWQALAAAALAIALSGVLQGLAGIVRNMSFEFLAQKLERDCRAELYESLLGKSQTWHSRQRIGDIMARSTNDVHFVNLMFSPGLALILDSAITAIVPLLMILTIDWRLLLVPSVFMAGLVVTVWIYNRTLNPLTDEQRESFGAMNATIADTLEGIEAVKGAVAEERELGKFAAAAKKLRDLYVRIALVQGRYWPLLVFAVCWGLAFLHALTLYTAGSLTVGQVIGYMMLFNGFEFTTFISIFLLTFSRWACRAQDAFWRPSSP